MEKKKAFLFDMDGVIVDSNPAHKTSLKEFCGRYGHKLSEEQLKEKIYGRTNKDWIPAVFGDIEESEMRRLAAEKEALFRKIYVATIRPLDGLIDFLRAAQEASVPMAIATSAPRENVDFTLENTGTGGFFDKILDESFVQKGKPDPEIYVKTARALGFSTENCIVFEDSLSGVKSGKSAGCKVVAISTTHSAEELHEADLVLENFVGIDPVKLISRVFS